MKITTLASLRSNAIFDQMPFLIGKIFDVTTLFLLTGVFTQMIFFERDDSPCEGFTEIVKHVD